MKLRCENLVKKYGPRTVVKGVSMEVNQGEIVGFLGPNGAGKTTSFYMITGLIVAVVLGIVAKKPGWGWLNNFIMAGSMIVGMVSSLLWTSIF